ncbi:hypothetical protein E4T56_gene17490 [Termitomyces sp. T112]|nr:hypothetical protein E4T56_gene17490 [Termitomyces sp. T112]
MEHAGIAHDKPVGVPLEQNTLQLCDLLLSEVTKLCSFKLRSRETRAATARTPPDITRLLLAEKISSTWECRRRTHKYPADFKVFSPLKPAEQWLADQITLRDARPQSRGSSTSST